MRASRRYQAAMVKDALSRRDDARSLALTLVFRAAIAALLIAAAVP
jgi:hypothetical protein